MKIKLDWFVWGMMVAVALAWIYPHAGAKDGWLHPDLLNKIGVALIFFLNGTGLSFASLRAGTLRWPVHAVIQLSTFLLFPLIGLGVLALTKTWITPSLGMGFFFLCALPSTVSSSVAMTAVAKGNVPVAVFNATLSSLLGVFLTPLWVGWVLKNGSQNSLPMGHVMLDLVICLICPLVAGQLSRPWLAQWAAANKKSIHLIDRGTILMIIYTSFCDSIQRGVWSGQGIGILAITLIGAAGLFFVVFYIVGVVCRLMKFEVEDRIAAIFCGSKKTIASGVPMAQIIFRSNPNLGIILLPLLIYHPMQLVICGVLAGRWGKRAKAQLANTLYS